MLLTRKSETVHVASYQANPGDIYANDSVQEGAYQSEESVSTVRQSAEVTVKDCSRLLTNTKSGLQASLYPTRARK